MIWWFINLKFINMVETLLDLKFPELEFTEPDNAAKESIFARKNRYIQLWFKQNFFNLG